MASWFLTRAALSLVVLAACANAFSIGPAGFVNRFQPRISARPQILSLRAAGFGAAAKDKKAAEAKAKKTVAPLPPPGTATPANLQKFDLGEGSQFMGAWIMLDENVCDDLVAYFESHPEKQLKGMVSMKGGNAPVINKEVKDSLEMSFAPKDPVPAWQNYLRNLQAVFASYVQEYPMCGAYGKWGLISRTNYQYYPPSGGYKTYHTERTGKGDPEGSRHLVFMTYLNDVNDAGGTEFYHQKLIVQPKKGLTLIWPADWTFTHRGVASPTEEKRIMTGWMNFIE